MNGPIVNREKSAKRQIYSWLKARIIAGEIRPGTVLDKRELMQTLSVSLTPLREALLLLKHDGYVELVPNLHTVVRLIDIARTREHVFIRAALECAVVEHLAAEGLPAQIDAACRDIIDRQRAAVADDDFVRSFELDAQFHAALCSVLKYRLLWENIQDNRAHIDRARQCSPINRPGIRRSIEQHAQILADIRRGDPIAARALMKTHVYTVFDDLAAIDPQYVESNAFADHAGTG